MQPKLINISNPPVAEKVEKKDEVWSIANLPPAGHEDVGSFFYQLYTESKDEKDRLHKPDLWDINYATFKGNHYENRKNKKKTRLSVNLFFSNVIRTVANIVNRDPVAEVKDLTGSGGNGDEGIDLATLYSRKLEKWWEDTNQHKKLRTSDINCEVYGITIEKPFWNSQLNEPDTSILDCYAVFPAPGYWEDISLDCPYICHAVPQPVSSLKSKYGNDDIVSDDYYYDLGHQREEHMPIQITDGKTSSVYTKGTSTYANRATRDDLKTNQALEVEIWVRDNSTCCKDGKDVAIYPGGIRCVTICNNGKIVLNDRKNPNINWAFTPDKYATNYLLKRLPFFKANSYEDTSSIWGFSALEQTYELLTVIEDLLSMAVDYHKRSAYGIMLVGKRSGIKATQLSNKPGLVLFPDSDVDQVKFVPLPSLPASYFSLVDLMISLHDRVYAIQDADRGDAPSGVIAASAIVSLQEKNAVLIQNKIDAIEKLVEARGHCAIALYQMHGHMEESIEVDGETFKFKGTDTAGRSFNYVVQAGSTQIKTESKRQEQSVALFEAQAIDREALLTDLNYPNMKAVLERMSERELDQALQLLIDAGLPEELAIQLREVLAEAQNRPESPDGVATGEAEPQPGTPRAYQGSEQPEM